MGNIKRELKLELKRMEKERKRCAKQYEDWKDDEYNCGPLKFIWGVLSKDDLLSCIPSFYTLNDIDIVYNRDTGKYLLGLETIYKFDDVEKTVDYLVRLKEKFSTFLKEPENRAEFKHDELYNYTSGELFIGNSVNELYWKFCIFVNGFKSIV